MAEMMRDEGRAEPRIEALLADANRLRAKGDLEGAEKRCRDALALAPGNWQAHELVGDLFYQRRRASEAIEHYRLARAANPQRQVLEDKIGRASLIWAEADITRLRAQELMAGKRDRPPRRPGVSALLSLLAPGFGHIYNGEHLKGAAIVCVWLMLVLGAGAAALSSLRGVGGITVGVVQFNLFAMVSVFFSPPTLWWTLLATGVWLFAITDATLRAAKTMTAPEDLA